MTPLLPKPKPSAKPEAYSVVVNNVRIQELLFALARDARMQIDIDPTLVRVITVILALFFGGGFLAYLLAWVIMPKA